MSDGNMTWIIAIVALLAGAAIGALLYRLNSGGAAENRRLKQRLAETELEVRQLRDGVNRHFGDIRELADDLAQQSEALRARLDDDAAALGSASSHQRRLTSNGASEAGSPPPATSKTGAAPAATPEDQAQQEIETLHVPRDYADGHGTLDEDYGLKEKKEKRDREEQAQPPRY